MSGPSPENRIAPLELALALPVLIWIAAATLVLVGTLCGYRALAAPSDLTMAEAAVLRDGAELLRQMRHGADPNAAAPIRRGILSDRDYILTPLEAAIAARHAEVVQLLVENGTTLDLQDLPRLLCLARIGNATEIVAFLESHHPMRGSLVDCSGIRTPW